MALIDTVDGGTRWVRLFAPTAVRTYYAMAVELVRICLGVDRDGLKIEGDHIDMIRADGTLATRIPLVGHQSVEINWFSHWIDAKRNPRVSY